MSDKLFKKILAVIITIGCISVIAMVAYTYYLYSDCSIISYIANGR